MEIKEGMYVRTKYGINKIDETFYTVSGFNHSYIDLENCYIDDEYELRQGISIEKIINASFNIIDLIEVGDYVNGKEVKHIAYFEGVEEDIPKLIFVDKHRLIPGETCENDEIKSIVTKEQFEKMEYKL